MVLRKVYSLTMFDREHSYRFFTEINEAFMFRCPFVFRQEAVNAWV